MFRMMPSLMPSLMKIRTLKLTIVGFFHVQKNATGGGCNTIEKMENRSKD